MTAARPSIHSFIQYLMKDNRVWEQAESLVLTGHSVTLTTLSEKGLKKKKAEAFKLYLALLSLLWKLPTTARHD